MQITMNLVQILQGLIYIVSSITKIWIHAPFYFNQPVAMLWPKLVYSCPVFDHLIPQFQVPTR